MTIAPTAGPTRVTREQVLALAPRPWEYLAVALQVVAKLPGEREIHRRAVEAFEALGLPTFARRLEGDRAACGPECIACDRRETTLRANFAALPDEAREEAAAGFDGWKAATAGWEWARAADGNLVRFEPATGRWWGVADQRGAAARFASQHLTPANTDHPLILEGLDPPWILLETHARTPARPDGFRTGVRIVEPELTRGLDALASADLREVLSRPGVELFLGSGGVARFERFLRGRFETRLVGAFIPLGAGGGTLGPMLRRLEREQLEEIRARRARVEERYRDRTPRWWGERYRSAGEAGRPLRVLIPTCRYTTFVRHSSEDLARAFEAAGWEAECFMEPDAHSRFSQLAYLRRLESFEPDLVVVINYTRTGLGELFPANVPFVCWIQDAMPHLFDAGLGASQGPLDFLAGHVFPELHDRFGFPSERSMPCVVGAGEAKFHAGPVASGVAKELECEVAYVSHHAETPDAMHDRLCREGAREPYVPRVFERLRETVRVVGEETMGRVASVVLREATRDALRSETGAEPTEVAITLVVRQYAAPMAERHVRHQTLRWAADIARRRGWRLRIHGRGWDRHAGLAEFARPALEHGEALRASYASAAVHLHMSVHALAHQRVFECLLSGGFPLCRLVEEERFNRVRFLRTRAFRGEMEPTLRDGDRLGVAVADDADLLAMARVQQLFGLRAEAVVWYRQKRRDLARRQDEIPQERQALWLLGDDPAHFFQTPEELEARLTYAIEHREARGALARAGAGRIRGRVTTVALVERLVGVVKGALA